MLDDDPPAAEEAAVPTEDGDSERDGRDLRAALGEALAALDAEDRPDALETADYRWLGVGLRLGVEHPEPARRLLAMLETPEAEQASQVGDPASDASQSAVPASQSRADKLTVDFRSTLLARSAALPLSGRAGPDPQPMFGWVAALTRAEILALGRVVEEMLATGSPPDIGRGFGFTWDAGVRLPREEREAMIGVFAELQITVGGVLAGRDLRAAPVERRRGLSGLLDPWLSRTHQTEAQAAAVIEATGEVAQRGLVALWNAWAALRYRALIPHSTFEVLVRPWQTVMGPLLEP